MNRDLSFANTDRLRMHLLSDEKCQLIFEAALRVLEQQGTIITHGEARNMLLGAGCQLDGDRVRIPARVVLDAIASAPKTVNFYDREGNYVGATGPSIGKPYVAAGMDCVYRIDPFTGERRLPTQKDAYQAGLVGSALENIDMPCGSGIISDCNQNLSDAYELRAVLEATHKFIRTWSNSGASLKVQMELAAVACGGMDKFRKHPTFLTLAAPNPPLGWGDSSVELLLTASEYGVPISCCSSSMYGLSAPVTLAGTYVMAFAESLTALVLGQLRNSGSPFLGGCWTGRLDMRTMGFATSGPEFALDGLATADLFRYINVPYEMNLGTSGSPIFDEQAALELCAQIYTGFLAGGICCFAGFIESGMSSSLDCMVFVDEVAHYMKHIIQGAEVNEETLAEQVINAVGPGGNFLGEEHTLTHFRERWSPKLFDETSREQWESAGKKRYHTRAQERVREIIAAGPIKPLDTGVIAEMDDILARAEKSFV